MWSEKHELILDRKTVFGESIYGCELDSLFNYDFFQTIMYRINPYNIRHLDFSDYRARLEENSNECLLFLSLYCPNLERLILNGLLRSEDFRIYEESFKLMCSNCTKLQEIDLSLSNINDANLSVLFSNCKFLNSINLAFCSSITGDCFWNHDLAFKKVKIEECTNLKEENIFCLLDKNKKNIEILTINNQLISNPLLYHILNHMPKLESLELHVCGLERIGSSSLNHLNELNIFHSLHTLDLSYSYGNDELMSFILQYCSSLKNLVLNNCEMLTDKMFWLRQINSPLEKLNLYSIGITDLTLKSLKQCASSLKWLKLMGCFELTSEGVANALHNLTSLIYLDVRFTTIDNHVIDKILELNFQHPIYIRCQGSAVNLDSEYESKYKMFKQVKIHEAILRNYIVLKKDYLVVEVDTDKETI